MSSNCYGTENVFSALVEVGVPDGQDGAVTKRATPSDELAGTIGAAIRKRRVDQGVTMQELANRAGLSQPFLSKVERGIAQLSMRALERVAQALGTSALGLFAGIGPELVTDVVRASERPHILTDDLGTGVAHAMTRRPGQLRIVEFVGGNKVMPKVPYLHRNDATSIVLEGTYEFESNGIRHTLEAGDTYSASGGVPHTYRVVRKPARMIVVIVSEDVQVVPDAVRPTPRKVRPTQLSK